MRQAGILHNEAVSHRAQADNLSRERERLHHRTAQAAEHLANLDVDLQELNQADEQLQARLTTARQQLAEQRQERDRLQQSHQDTQQLVADLRAERSGLASRIEVLEGLERSHEGLGTGVREVLALRAQPDPGPWRTVLGMIADLLTVRHEYAPLIDLALGEWSQRFLVRDVGQLGKALQQRSQPFSGRVSFLPLRPPGGCGDTATRGHGDTETRGVALSVPVSPCPRVPVSEHPGVVAVAAQLVTCENPELAELPAQLLGCTLIVRDLAAARDLAAHAAGYRIVTLQGELLDADGTLTVGTHHAETGILSRKSELRELRHQAAALDRRIADAERDLNDLRDRLAALGSRLASIQEEIDVLAEQATDLKARIVQHRQRRDELHEEAELHRVEISGLEREIQAQEENWQRAKSQAEAADRQVQALEARLKQAEVEIRRFDQQHQERQREFTAAKVELAKAEERLQGLEARHRQHEADLGQRRQEQSQGEHRLTAARQRLQESQRTMLNASAALARGYLDKEAAEQRVAELSRERDLLRQERQALADRAQAVRGAWQEQQSQAHSHELEANTLGLNRTTLVERLREDYQVDLAGLYESYSPQTTPREEAGPSSAPSAVPPDAAAANEEIAELRRKLSRLGSVNLDSLQELAELESRATTLQAQHDDLTAAKRSLEEIIDAINQDSRRLFTDTFTAIRTHFQELFRKLFGGGMADIVLEDEADILESGIEIIARPPGKELRSISLMSGGEKTLTAVALLLAIFRSKPSPFCILDEVDAALDEANIDRYTAVLRDFLDRSQFIIITHSKKTMAAADVLYGITMQESGVSKRVAIRFEDWPDDGPPPGSANGSGNGHLEVPTGEQATAE
jgi:chromosome segregation protein